MIGLKQFDLSGRVAVVTGGSKGLGLSMATGLASAGAEIVIVSRHESEAKAVAEQLAKQFGRRAIGVQADVALEADTTALADRVIQEFGRIDILINKAVIPHMRSNKSGRIINLASALGAVGMPDRTPYCTSKGAVVQMTRALAAELAPFNITVNAILPGPFLTEMNVPVKDDPQFKQFILGSTSLGRWGELHEIQGAALYLASDASSYTTGCMLAVDGGWTAR